MLNDCEMGRDFERINQLKITHPPANSEQSELTCNQNSAILFVDAESKTKRNEQKNDGESPESWLQVSNLFMKFFQNFAFAINNFQMYNEFEFE